MWQRFDERARQAIYKAQENAERLRCASIDSDLLFLGCFDIDQAACLQALLNGIDHAFESTSSHSGSHPIAETMADAVHLASSRRESLVAAHMLAAMYCRVGSIVNIAAPPHYASPEEMLDRLVPKGG